MSSEELKRFYKSRLKKPELFTYDNDGNLVELNKDGSIIKTISLPEYRLPTYEELDEMEQKRLQEIVVANKDFEDKRKELRSALTNPEMTDSDILRLNRKVKEADIKLQSVRFPLTQISSEDGISINQIDFDKSYEKRKYPYPFYFLQERPYNLQEQYVRIGKVPSKPLLTVQELNRIANSASVPLVILFQDPETNNYGFMSLKWTVEIEFNGTMYNSAHQAILAELAKAFNDQEGLQKIMSAETPDEVIYKLDDVPGDKDANETKWNATIKQLIYDVNIAKFNQYPELTARLLETTTAVLGAYLPNDNLIGIGISIDNILSKNPINWTGQNLLGKALMDIRDKLRSDREVLTMQQQEQQQQQQQQQQQVPSQAVIRRKKPVIASQPVVQESLSEISTPRQPRRRPKPAIAPV